MTKNYNLREFKSSDALAMIQALNTDKIDRDTTIELPWGIDNAKWWISFIENSKTEKHFVIESDGRLVGSIGLINKEEHRAEIGYWIDAAHEGKGIATGAIADMVKYGFENMGVARIFAPVLTHNKASAHVLEKNGFVLEGTLKDYYKKKGKFVDAWCYAIVRG